LETHTVETTRRIEIYDTTLRDGSQGEGVSFSLADKLKITQHLDDLGVDFVEGGYPLSNPKDSAFFVDAKELKLRHARLCAFGMTRRRGIKPADDPGMKALVDASLAGQGAASVITIVGKTWDLHVDEVLQISRQENLDMIGESVDFCRRRLAGVAGGEVFYDAEHFFDGFRANPDYALQTLKAAMEGGATRLILCDTNGGSLPENVTLAVQRLLQWLREQGAIVVTSAAPFAAGKGDAGNGPASRPAQGGVGLGIHTHNDGGLAVANSLAAVQAGCCQVQGTINGIGERCGNVDLTTVAANLRLKLGMDCLWAGEAKPAKEADAQLAPGLHRLTEASRFVYELANLNLQANQPFVGSSAFAHKGGMHVHAVQRVTRSYEHIDPELVGNTRRVLVSELSGVSNIAATLGRKFNVAQDKTLQRKLVQRVAELENQGYQFEAADASFELLLHDLLGRKPAYWQLDHFRCVIFHEETQGTQTEATVKLRVGKATELHVGEGDGPVNALDMALRKCLQPHYPLLVRIHLRDYKVRVVNATAESAAKVRVVIDFAVSPDGQLPGHASVLAGLRHFATIGVSENIVDASWQALTDAFNYHLIECGIGPPGLANK
jgi:2-isopropylmalate synthase